MIIADVINYIYDRKANSTYERWTRGQICSEIFNLIELKQILVIDNGYHITGLVIFNPNYQDKFWINHIWGNNFLVLSKMIKFLETNYPKISEVYGYRHKRRIVRFKLTTLKKIFYGRRSSSTAS